MCSKVRAELSEKSTYWISKERFYELRHFCRQYPEWEKMYRKLESNLLPKCLAEREVIRINNISNPTERIAILRAGYKNKIDMVKSTAEETDPELAYYILKSVTEGRPYSYLQTVLDIQCSKNTFYDRYRKFFWLLSQKRD